LGVLTGQGVLNVKLGTRGIAQRIRSISEDNVVAPLPQLHGKRDEGGKGASA